MNRAFRSGFGALVMLLASVASARGTNHQVLIDEVLGGCGVTHGAQFVEIIFPQGQNQWAGCAGLEFHDAQGAVIGSLDFTTNPPDPLPVNSALVATVEFARLPGAPRPDYIMPPLVSAPVGEVCFRDTGRPGCFPVRLCLAYGDAACGDRAPALPPDGAQSLRRFRAGEFGSHENADFGLFPPSPRNAVGETGDLRCASQSLVAEGERLFFEETFDGNGRTCGTCHPAAHAFTMDASVVASLPSDDPLFVAENEPALAGLELPRLLRGPRTLVLENVDGLDRPPVFRGTPHLLNVGLTGPWGLSGDVPDLRTFAAGAVRQHFPRTLNRIPGVDFREPTDEELAALEAFMETIFAGDPAGLDPSRLVLGSAASRGRDLFFGEARCSICHAGSFLSGLFGVTFDTGVTRQGIDQVPPPECPGCAPIGPLEHGRAFDVPSLVGVRDTAPFFHDNSAPTLRDAVAFYDSRSFNDSPAAQLVGPISLRPGDIDDLTAFLASLTACGNGVVDRGEACDDGNLRDGDCCSSTCQVAAADGSACDDGDGCTQTECRAGACIVLDAGVCGSHGCTASDTLTPDVVTCAVATIVGDATHCPAHDTRIKRKIDRAVRLVESALGGDPSRRARKPLRAAAVAFGRAARLASDNPEPGCEPDVAGAARRAQQRALCARECVTRRDVVVP